jgi:non-specific serine/threonine protein kinase
VTDDTRLLRQVRDALQCLHDRPRLQVHPLLARLPSGTSARALQAAIEEAIAALEPPPGTPATERASRIHRLLRLRYVEGVASPLVWKRLGVGKSEYYREHGRGVAAVASLLRERWCVPPGGPGQRPPAPPAVLPVYPTSFVGRDAESAEVTRLLTTSRLLTLTGAGGVGKTRLALQVAAGLRGAYPDGVGLVELEALSEPALVPAAAAAALGLPEETILPLPTALVDLLGPKRHLLVLDNCEHLVEACAVLVDRLLRGCPHLRVLATSREPLGVAGETTWAVPPLSLPPNEPTSAGPPATASQVLTYEAVRLFRDRARAARPDFEVVDETAAAVAEVCRRLDGIPLAIELAAGRVRALSVGQIASRLDDRFRLLAGGSRTALARHQTLRATVDWSWGLLAPRERAVLRRLAAFAGGCDLEAAEAVCRGGDVAPEEVLGLLAALVDKSLVAVEERDGAVRYRLLETIRLYAAGKLAGAREEHETRRRHRDWFLLWAERTDADLGGLLPARWHRRLTAEQQNLRAALRWSKADEGGADAELRLVAALARFWYHRRGTGEGRVWLADALSRCRAPTPARADALAVAGRLEAEHGDVAAGRRYGEEAVETARRLGDRRRLARALRMLAVTRVRGGDPLAARPLCEEALAAARGAEATGEVAEALLQLGRLAEIAGDLDRAGQLLAEGLAVSRGGGHARSLGAALVGLAGLARTSGEFARARSLLGEALAVFRDSSDLDRLASALGEAGDLARAEGDPALARVRYLASLRTAQEAGAQVKAAAALVRLAGLERSKGRPERAVRLLGAEQAWRASAAMHGAVGPLRPPRPDRHVAALIRRLGAERFAAAWQDGQAMTLEEATAYALADAEPPVDGPDGRVRRERGVAARDARDRADRPA